MISDKILKEIRESLQRPMREPNTEVCLRRGHKLILQGWVGQHFMVETTHADFRSLSMELKVHKRFGWDSAVFNRHGWMIQWVEA